MRYLPIASALLGILLLSLLLLLLPPKPVSSASELSSLSDNSKVAVKGIVVKEKFSQNLRYLTIKENITLLCDCSNLPHLINKNVSVIALLDRYDSRTYLKVLKIKYR